MKRQQRILIADDVVENRKLLAAILASLDCQVDTAADGRETLAKLSPETDLLLLDLLMPDIDGLGVMRRLRADSLFSDLPVIMVTGRETREDRLRAVEAGVSDFIAKPVARAEVLVRVRAQLRMKAAQDEVKRSRLALEETVTSRTADLRHALADMKAAQSMTKDAHLDTIRRLVLAAELKDRDTSEHIVRISRYCAVLGRALGMPADEVEIGSHAATMHDVGKIGIPDAILRKRGPLTESERRVMQTHTEIGASILAGSPSELMQAGETIAISHHEKWDGSGYPHQLAGVAIPLWGRICAIVDVFDALTSRRSYRQAVSDAQAVEIMLPDLGRHFDPQLFGVFMAHLDQILSVAQESRAGARQGPAPPPHLPPSRRERRESDQGPACR
jgi:putative two-component system response regulator